MRQELLIVGLLVAALGCNSDPRCRRETALLRAEILDLEDKYYLTKAQRDDALAALQSQGKADIASKIAMRSPGGQEPQCEEIYYGEAVYEGGMLNAPQPIVTGQSGPAEMNQGTLAPAQSDIIYDDLRFPSVQNGTVQPQTNATSPRSSQGRKIAPREAGLSEGSILAAPADEQPKSGETTTPQNSAPQNSTPGTTPANTDAAGPSTFNLGNRNPNQSTFRNSSSLPVSPVTEVVVERNESFVRVDELDSTSLTLLLKPRDASGNPRRTSGSLTVSIVDPFSSSPDKPLGIWKFLPEEVELFFTEPNSEPGIRLSLPFEDGIPQGKHVVVMVRMQTPDGRALETTSRIPTAKSKIKINQGEEDLLAEGEKAARPAWRPVR